MMEMFTQLYFDRFCYGISVTEVEENNLSINLPNEVIRIYHAHGGKRETIPKPKQTKKGIKFGRINYQNK